MESSEIANITIHLVVAIPKQPTSSSQVLTISQSHNHNKLYNYMLQVSKYHQKLMMSRCLPVLPIHRISQDIFPEGSHIPGLLMSLASLGLGISGRFPKTSSHNSFTPGTPGCVTDPRSAMSCSRGRAGAPTDTTVVQCSRTLEKKKKKRAQCQQNG